MARALELAKNGGGFVNPNPQVGAVIVKAGEVIATGYHRKFGGPHAEVNALEEAGERAEGATMYVTLEPCVHYGKTPPCSDEIIKRGLERVHVAIEDPNPKVSGKGIEKLRGAGIKVTLGLLNDEAEQVNEIFLHYTETGRPFVLLKLAMTFDGKIATRTGDSRWITSGEARQEVHRLRGRYSGVVVGVGTVISDDPCLNVRDAEGPDGARFVLDTSGRTPLESRLFQLESSAPTIMVVGEDLPSDRAGEFERLSADIWRMPVNDRGIDLEAFLDRAGENGYDSLLVEGGSEIAGSFADLGLIDKVNFFYSPKIIGGREAVPGVGGEGALKVDEGIELDQVEVGRTGPDISVVGYPSEDQ